MPCPIERSQPEFIDEADPMPDSRVPGREGQHVRARSIEERAHMWIVAGAVAQQNVPHRFLLKERSGGRGRPALTLESDLTPPTDTTPTQRTPR